MKKTLYSTTAASILFATSLLAQTIDYGMVAAQVQSPVGTPLPVSSGGFQLYVTNGSFTPSASSTLADITSNMRLVTGSFSSIDAGLPGQFYAAAIAPATASGSIATGTLLYALASTSSTFESTAPWALVTGTDDSWKSPNITDPAAFTVIELSFGGNSIVAAGNGGPGVGAFFGATPGTTISGGDANLTLVPEPSTYALLSLAGLALGGYAARRRLRA